MVAPMKLGRMEPSNGDLDQYSAALADAVEQALPSWVEGHVTNILMAFRRKVTDVERAEAQRAGLKAQLEVAQELRTFLALDIDQQRTNPLAILRLAVRYPTAVLRAAGVPEVKRDDFAEESFPADVYDLSPARWLDLGEPVHDAGLMWGAWKAKQHLDRRAALDAARADTND
jgi:hypothetical protein